MATTAPAPVSPAEMLQRATAAALGMVEIAQHTHFRAGIGGPVPPEVVVPWLAAVVEHLGAAPLLDGVRAEILRARNDDNPVRWGGLAESTWHDVAFNFGPTLARVLAYSAAATLPAGERPIDTTALQAEADAIGRRLQESWRSQPLFCDVAATDFENLALGVQREAELTAPRLTTAAQPAPAETSESNLADELEIAVRLCLAHCNTLRMIIQSRVGPDLIEFHQKMGNPQAADDIVAVNRQCCIGEAKAWADLATDFRRLHRAYFTLLNYANAAASKDFVINGRKTCRGAVSFCHQWAWALVEVLAGVDARARKKRQPGGASADAISESRIDLEAGRYSIDAEAVLRLGDAPRLAAAARMTPWPTDEEVAAVRQELVSECALVRREWNRDQRQVAQPLPPPTAETPGGALAVRAGGDKSKPQKRRSTVPGAAWEKIKAALTEHHGYQCGGSAAGSSCTNYEPIQVKQFAKQIGVAHGSVSKLLTDQFGNYEQYKRACEKKGGEALRLTLAAWNDDLRPARILSDAESSRLVSREPSPQQIDD